MKKYIFGLLALFLLVSCGNNTSNETTSEPQTNNEVVVEQQVEEKQEKILVASSIVPLSSVVSSVGWDFVEVENIVPAGVSPHGFDLSAQKMAQVSKSEKVFMIGLEHIDGFLNKAVSEEKQVHVADGMELIEVKWHEHDEHEEEGHDEHGDDHHDEDEHHDDEHKDEEHHDDHEDEDEHEDEHEEEGHDEHNHSEDPHVWLGKDNIIQIAQQVRDELTKILPEQGAYFASNTDIFISELEKVYSDFETEVAGKTAKEFIVFHDAYNYLMQSIGMDLNTKVPFSENVLHDTSTAHLAELVEEIELHGIRHAFTEPQFESGNLQKLANDYNLTVGTLDPHGTNPGANGYLENLKSNLENLANVYE